MLPYLGPAVEETLEIEGKVGTLDVFFSVDTTGSFRGEIDNLQAELRSRILPDLRARVGDVGFGVGKFEDFPFAPFGSPEDRPFVLLSPVTTAEAPLLSAVARLDQPLGSGGDPPESAAEALYQIATGEGLSPWIAAYGGEGLGGVGFRENAFRVVVQISDATPHRAADYPPTVLGAHSQEAAEEALVALNARVLGIASAETARPYLDSLALATGASMAAADGFCPTGIDGRSRPSVDGRCPLVFDVRADGTGLSSTIVEAISNLLNTIGYAQVWVETDDRLSFIQEVRALPAEAPDASLSRADLRPSGDGLLDTFLDVPQGTSLRFALRLQNTSVPPADYDQYFTLRVEVVGDGVTLRSRQLRVLVPRGRIADGGT